jgi:hypothetical protein
MLLSVEWDALDLRIYLLLSGSVDVTYRRMKCVGFAYLKLLSRNYLRKTEKKLIKSLAGVRAENCRYSNDNALPLYVPSCVLKQLLNACGRKGYNFLLFSRRMNIDMAISVYNKAGNVL